MALLEIRHLVKDFGGVRAIDGLDLDVEEGQILSVIGPNGAGKTTLFNAITGMIPPESGEITFDGESIVGLRPSQVMQRGISRAMASGPKLILLDEPTAGMNPMETRELTGLISEIRDQLGVTVLLIEHEMKVVKGASEHVVVLDFGQKIAEGSFDEVVTNERVIEAYLGRKATAAP